MTCLNIIDGVEYMLMSCLSGEQFWMPTYLREQYWATDFWDQKSAIELTQGLAA